MTDLELMKRGYSQIEPSIETEKAYGCIDSKHSRLEGPAGTTFIHYNWYPKSICVYDNVGHIFVPNKFYRN